MIVLWRGTSNIRSLINEEKIFIEEPTSLRELQAFPLVVSCFRHQARFEFCELVERFQFHHELARIFVAHLHNNEVTIAEVIFKISPTVILDATRIPTIGEKMVSCRKSQFCRQN